MQKAVFPIQSHADITKAISFMHTNYTRALEENKPLRVVIRKHNRLINNIEEQLHQGERRERR